MFSLIKLVLRLLGLILQNNNIRLIRHNSNGMIQSIEAHARPPMYMEKTKL